MAKTLKCILRAVAKIILLSEELGCATRSEIKRQKVEKRV